MKDFWVSIRYSKTGIFLKNYGRQFGLTLLTVASLVGVMAGTQLIQRRSFENSQASKNSSDAAIRTMRIVKVFYEPPGTDIVSHYNLPTLHTNTMDLVSRASAYHDGTIRNINVVEVHPGFIVNSTRPNPDNTKYGALKATLNSSAGNLAGDGKTVCDVVNELDIDQVWLWVNPAVDSTPGDEFAIINRTSNYGIPQAQYSDPACSHDKSFVVMGFDMTVGSVSALHSFGHYMENLLTSLQGRDLFVNRFMGVDYDFSNSNIGVDGVYIPGFNLSEKCGSIHVPPNVPVNSATLTYPGYQYNVSAEVLNICASWRPDANLTNAPTSVVNNQTWRALWDDAMTIPDRDDPTTGGYYLWWFQNMPNAGSVLTYNLNNVDYKLPNWWDFVADTDKQILDYYLGGYWLNPALKIPENASNTTSAYGTSGSGVQTDWTHTPTSSNTLGVSDPAEVLAIANAQTSSQYVNMALVTASYTPTQNPSAQLTSVRYCGVNMARIAGSNGLAKYGPYTSEMWYLLNPPAGNCEVIGIFSADPGERLMSATIFNNIDSTGAIISTVRAGSSTSATSTIYNTVKASSTGPKDSVFMCNLATKPYMHSVRSFYSLWFREENAIYAHLASSNQRTADNQNMAMEWIGWDGSTVYPWALMCANFKVKPFASIATQPPTETPAPSTPTPLPSTPSPTPTPTPTPPPPTVTPPPAALNPIYVCWEKVSNYEGEYIWPTGCGGTYSSSLGVSCTQAIKPLTPTEIIAYQDWVAAGKPATPCNGGPTPPPTTQSADVYAIAQGAFLTNNNIISLQAENYDANIPRSNHQWRLRTNISGYTGNGFMAALPDNTSGGSNALSLIPSTQAELSFKVYFAQPGTYYVWLRGSGPDGTGDSVHIGVNGVVTDTSDQLSLTNGNSFYWRSLTYDGIRPTIRIDSAGRHTISLYKREDGARVDRLLFTTSSTYKP